MPRIAVTDASVLGYEIVGDGLPIVALHGAYSTRAEVRGFLEPMLGNRAVRRIYVDLPGHGGSRPSGDVRSPDDVLDLIDRLLRAEVPDGPFLLLGHSFGAAFARAVAARHAGRVSGLALLCPVMAGERVVEDAVVVRDDSVSSDLDPQLRREFEGYFVVRTAETLARFRQDVVPSLGPVDTETLERAIEPGPFRVDPDAVPLGIPVLVMAGRHDSFVGWRRQQGLVDTYPRATVVTVADAGHALPHERPALVAALLDDWLAQVG